MLIAQQIANGLVVGAGYALVAVGLTLIFGVLDILNFAHGEFTMLGALALFVLGTQLGLSYFAASLISIAILFFLGVLVQRIILSRLPEHDHLNALLLTFALSTFILAATDLALGPTSRELPSVLDTPVEIGPAVVTGQKLLTIAAGVGLVAALHFFLKRSQWGRKIRAVSQNSVGSAVCGIDMPAVKYWTFGLGTALAAVAGVLIGPSTFFTPDMGQAQLIKAFVVVVLGGMGNVVGTAIAAFFLGLVEMLAVVVLPGGWRDLIAFAVLIVVLLVRPQGFASRRL